MQIHKPLALYPHYAFVSAPFGLTKEFEMQYDGRSVDAVVERTIQAGVYGFTSIEARDKFVALVHRVNKDKEDAADAYACSSHYREYKAATDPVVRGTKPRRRNPQRKKK